MTKTKTPPFGKGGTRRGLLVVRARGIYSPAFAMVRSTRVVRRMRFPPQRLVWRFTMKVRRVARFEWLTLLPVWVPRPVISQVRLIAKHSAV